jgi:hypothetical protein
MFLAPATGPSAPSSASGHRPHRQRPAATGPTASGHRPHRHRRAITQDVKDAKVVVVSCGLLNFEINSLSNKKSTDIRDYYTLTSGYFDDVPCNALHDRELTRRFVKSFKTNYPVLCEGREITVVDCLGLRDPGHDKSLRNHRGTHDATLRKTVEASRFQQVNEPLRKIGEMHDKKHLAINVCKQGRHRSVANKTIQKPALREHFCDNDPDQIRDLDLAYPSHWRYLCKDCDHCDFNTDDPVDPHADTIEKGCQKILKILGFNRKVEEPSSEEPPRAKKKPRVEQPVERPVDSPGRESSPEQWSRDQASDAPDIRRRPRTPATITDTRFLRERVLRETRCEQCGKPFSGNEAGAYCHRENMPPAGERKAAWERGDWDATWYCIGCYMEYYDCSPKAIFDMLGFTGRAAKKARYA